MPFDARAAKLLQPGEHLILPEHPGLRLQRQREPPRVAVPLQVPVDGGMRQVKLGEWPAMGYQEAVASWEKKKAERDSGVDPALQKRTARRQEREAEVAKRRPRSVHGEAPGAGLPLRPHRCAPQAQGSRRGAAAADWRTRRRLRTGRQPAAAQRGLRPAAGHGEQARARRPGAAGDRRRVGPTAWIRGGCPRTLRTGGARSCAASCAARARRSRASTSAPASAC
jgi:hypothetical protein